MAMKINKNLVASSMYKYKCPYTMTPTRIVVHNTANDASAKNEISYMRRNYNYSSFHYAVDDKEIWQGVRESRNSWNAGDGKNGTGNRKGISIEICYSKSGGKRFDQAERRSAEFIAEILKRKRWSIKKVTKHQDYSGKYCPHRTIDRGWNRYLSLIESYMKDWKDDFVKYEKTLYAKGKAYLYEIDTNKKIKTYKKGDHIGVGYKSDDFYMTKYSYDRGIKNGFKVGEWTDGTNTCEAEITRLEVIVGVQKINIGILKEERNLLKDTTETQKIKIAQLESQVLEMEAENAKLEKYKAFYEGLGEYVEVKKV